MATQRLMLPTLLVTTLLGAACDPELELVSEVDDRPLAEALNLLHIMDVLDEPDVSMGELLERANELTLGAAPDPTALLTELNELDDARSATGGTSLRLLTQNAAMLDAPIFWVIPYARTPYLDERREENLEHFLVDDPDVVFLQEVWVNRDLEFFTAAAADLGYLASPGNRDGYNDGLLTLVRESIVDGALDEGAQVYQEQDGLEFFPGPGIKRGFQWVAFNHTELGPMVLVNTHAQAFPDKWQNRMRQARQMGIAVRDLAGDDTIAFVAGDMNAGPYYRDDTWLLPDDGEEPDWWKNAMSWPFLLEYGGLTDLAISGRPADEALADIFLGDTVVNDPEVAVTTPGGQSGWCDETPHITFTASDCNSLYFEQYGATEYPARLDHIMVRDVAGRVRATSSRIVGTEKQDFGGLSVEPSDHYGVLVEVMIDGT